MHKRFSILLIACVLVGFSLRVWRIADFPSGSNQDELLRAYDAYSLVVTGKDHRGNPWPLYFAGFSIERDNSPPLFTYATIPLVALLGPTVVAVRFTAAFLGALTIASIALLVLAVTDNKRLTLAAAGLIAFSPWHIFLSRFGNEFVTEPLFFALAPGLLVWGLRRRSTVVLALSAVAFALGLYAYSPLRLLLPIAGVTVLMFYRRDAATFGWKLLLPAIVFITLIFPAASYYLPGPTMGRFREVSIVSQTPYWPAYVLAGVLGHASPLMLQYFVVFEAFLLAAGVVIGRKSFTKWHFFGCLSVCAVIASALTVPTPHFGRSSALIVPAAAFMAFGAGALLRAYRKLPRIRRQLSVVAAVIVLFASFAEIPALAYEQHIMFVVGLDDLIRAAAQRDERRIVITTSGVQQPYIHVLSALQVQPEELHLERKMMPNGWEHVSIFDRWAFCKPEECAVAGDLAIVRKAESTNHQVLQSKGVFELVRW